MRGGAGAPGGGRGGTGRGGGGAYLKWGSNAPPTPPVRPATLFDAVYPPRNVRFDVAGSVVVLATPPQRTSSGKATAQAAASAPPSFTQSSGFAAACVKSARSLVRVGNRLSEKTMMNASLLGHKRSRRGLGVEGDFAAVVNGSAAAPDEEDDDDDDDEHDDRAAATRSKGAERAYTTFDGFVKATGHFFFHRASTQRLLTEAVVAKTHGASVPPSNLKAAHSAISAAATARVSLPQLLATQRGIAAQSLNGAAGEETSSIRSSHGVPLPQRDPVAYLALQRLMSRRVAGGTTEVDRVVSAAVADGASLEGWQRMCAAAPAYFPRELLSSGPIKIHRRGAKKKAAAATNVQGEKAKRVKPKSTSSQAAAKKPAASTKSSGIARSAKGRKAMDDDIADDDLADLEVLLGTQKASHSRKARATAVDDDDDVTGAPAQDDQQMLTPAMKRALATATDAPDLKKTGPEAAAGGPEVDEEDDATSGDDDDDDLASSLTDGEDEDDDGGDDDADEMTF